MARPWCGLGLELGLALELGLELGLALGLGLELGLALGLGMELRLALGLGQGFSWFQARVRIRPKAGPGLVGPG